MRVIVRVTAHLALVLVVALTTMAGETCGYEYGFKIMNL